MDIQEIWEFARDLAWAISSDTANGQLVGTNCPSHATPLDWGLDGDDLVVTEASACLGGDYTLLLSTPERVELTGAGLALVRTIRGVENAPEFPQVLWNLRDTIVISEPYLKELGLTVMSDTWDITVNDQDGNVLVGVVKERLVITPAALGSLNVILGDFHTPED